MKLLAKGMGLEQEKPRLRISKRWKNIAEGELSALKLRAKEKHFSFVLVRQIFFFRTRCEFFGFLFLLFCFES